MKLRGWIQFHFFNCESITVCSFVGPDIQLSFILRGAATWFFASIDMTQTGTLFNTNISRKDRNNQFNYTQ